MTTPATLAELLIRETKRFDRTVLAAYHKAREDAANRIIQQKFDLKVQEERAMIEKMKRRATCTTSPVKKERYLHRMKSAEVRLAALLLSK